MTEDSGTDFVLSPGDADEAVAACVISHHNLADLHLRLNQPEESAEYLCAIHQRLLQTMQDERLRPALRGEQRLDEMWRRLLQLHQQPVLLMRGIDAADHHGLKAYHATPAGHGAGHLGQLQRRIPRPLHHAQTAAQTHQGNAQQGRGVIAGGEDVEAEPLAQPALLRPPPPSPP